MKFSTVLVGATFATIHGLAFTQAATWKDVSGQETLKLVALSASKTAPEGLPFIPERMKETGFWQSYSDPKIVAKLGETMAKGPDAGWQDTGLWMHCLGTDGSWVSLPVCQTARAAQGGVRTEGGVFIIHPALWKNLQSTRPAPRAENSGTAVVKAKTGAFQVSLGEMDGTAQTPDDRKINPFLKYDGDAGKEEAQVDVPADYDGSKPYGLVVFITPAMNGNNGLPGAWQKDFAARNLIWIGARNSGNNHPGDRRVWLAQQARAWALHHYKIDPARMVISGFSNGGDAASATAVATPFGFNNAILFAPPCEPPLGPVSVPQEKDAKDSRVVSIKPLSSSGISNIKKTWRIAYVCGADDKFLGGVKKSAEAVKGLHMGSKFFEVPGLGHNTPGEITEVLNFIFSPRVGAGAKGSLSPAFDVGPVISSIRSTLTSNPAKARETMMQLWRNHPEVRDKAGVTKLLATMEALP